VEALALDGDEEVVAAAGAVEDVEVRRLRERLLEQSAQRLSRHGFDCTGLSGPHSAVMIAA
jgi:hypothetical protein